MRRTFLGLLLTFVVFSTNAGEFTCRRSHLSRALAAETAEETSTISFSAKTSTSHPFARSERKASEPPGAKESASFPTKHSHSTAPPLTAKTREAAEKEHPSMAGRGRDEGRSLRQDDVSGDEATTSEAPWCLRELFLDASGLGLSRRSLFVQRANHQRPSQHRDANVEYRPFASH